MSDVDDQMMAALTALMRDEVRHDVNSPDDGSQHRIVVNDDAGPWVSAYAIARNGIYCATTPLFAEYFGHAMPRVFFAIAIQEHPNELRQPSPRAHPRSAGDKAVSNPDPGGEEGIETAPPSVESPPSRAPDGGAVPRLSRDCPACSGTGTIL